MYMGSFNGHSVKPHELTSCGAWVGSLRRNHPGRMASTGLSITKTWTDAAGRKRFTGGADLKATQTYSPEFGCAVAAAFSEDRCNEELLSEQLCCEHDAMDDANTPTFTEALEDLNVGTVLTSYNTWDVGRCW